MEVVRSLDPPVASKNAGLKQSIDSDVDSQDTPAEKPREDEMLAIVARAGAEFVSIDDEVGFKKVIISLTEAIRHMESVSVLRSIRARFFAHNASSRYCDEQYAENYRFFGHK